MKVCLQAGHAGRTSGATGAPGEIVANIRIRDRLSQILVERGFVVQLANADPTFAEINKDYDLFLALHCDADYPNDNGSGFADYPEPSTDTATVESQRICKVINDFYFPEVKINYVNHSNANTRYYYMWQMMSAATPCVLIEMGQIQDPHDSVLLANTELIAGALGRAICKAFNVQYDLPPATPPTIPSAPPQVPTTPVMVPDPALEAYRSDLITCRENLIYWKNLVKQVRDTLWGSGFWWTKWARIKALLPK